MIQSRSSKSIPSSENQSKNYRSLLREATIQIRKLRTQLDNIEKRQAEPIAIVGMACRFPGEANTPEAYWDLLRNGVDTVGKVPTQRWDIDAYYDPDPAAPGKMYTRSGSFINHVDQFDPQFFGISPREAHSLDPQQRLLLEVSHNALENAGIPAFDQKGSATGVFVGLCFDDYAQRSVRSSNPALIDAFSSLGNTRSVAAGRIAYVFGFQGPTMQLDTTCSSSLLAIHLACQSLRNGECNLALAGGVNLMLSPEAAIGFCKLQALAPDGRCKTFDAAADGYGRGEGCGVVVLKRMSDAVHDRDNILALIKGSAVNHDGSSNGLTAPNGAAQTAVIRQALSNARLDPEQIQYVEAHGTGTSLGDPIELIALDQALDGRSDPLLVGSVKTNFGHLEAAAGVAGLMKVILALQHQQIPPHLHLNTPNSFIPWERLAIQVPTQLTPWPETSEPKRAGLSSFGMSGTNVHLILEEAVSAEAAPLENPFCANPERSLHLLTLSARSESALKSLALQYQAWLMESKSDSADICVTSNTGRSHFTHRLAVSAANIPQLGQQLNHAIEQRFSHNLLQPVSSHHPKIGFLFTGQGSQYVRMGQELFETEPVFQDAIHRCAEILEKDNIPLLKLLYPALESSTLPSKYSIHDTTITQPALFALEYALAKLWQFWGIEPDYVLGHSIGEYAAACIAGVFSLEDGLRLIAARGRLMQSLPEGGGMVAVMAASDPVAELLSDGVEIAAVNGPQNTVISGELSALNRVVTQLESRNYKIKWLKVSHGFHSALMEPILAEFQQIAQAIQYRQPNIDFISSVTGQSMATEIGEPSYWVNQIRQPVQFSLAMDTLANENCKIFIEIGPRPTLVSMGQLCIPAEDSQWLPSLSPAKVQNDVRSEKTDWQTLTSTLSRLYEAGCSINWANFNRNCSRKTVLLPSYPFQRKRYWLETASESSPPNLTSTIQYPLLGQQLSLAGDTVRCYTSFLQWDNPLIWQDHRVFQSVLMPAAAYLEMVLAAGREIYQDASYEVTNVSLLKGLWLSESNSIHLQTLVNRQELDQYSFEIHSRHENDWVQHSTGNIQSSSAQTNLPGLNFKAIQHRLTNTLSSEQFYERCVARGIEYGPSFRAVQQVWLGDGEALAQVALTPSSTVLQFQMHPVLLDAGLQLAGATLEESLTPYLPVAVERFYCCQAPEAAWIYAQKRHQAVAQPVIDVTWVDAQHQTVAVLQGLTLQAVESPNHPTQWFHQVVWENQPLPLAPGAFLVSPQAVSDAIASQFTQLVQQPDFLTYQDLQTELNTLTLAYIIQAFSQLGWTPQSNRHYTSKELAHILGIVSRHQKLFNHCLILLQKAHVLTTVNGLWQVPNELPHINLRDLEERLQEKQLLSTELSLLQRCGTKLASVFQGQVNPLDLLFPQGNLTDLAQLYQSSVGAQAMNQLLRRAIATAIAHVPLDRPLRVLEIGAGTGGTTSQILPLLADLSHPVTYIFTDISSRFTRAARDQFQKFLFTEYKLLDIEQSPVAQGYKPDFDLVIAANVLHATADIQQTLNHVRELLAPGGQLFLLEGTQPMAWVDLIFGLTSGWWRFNDHDLRQDHPLLSVSQWHSVLKEVGFNEVVALKTDDTSQEFAQTVIIAQSETATLNHWYLLGNLSSIRPLASRLETQHQITRTFDAALLDMAEFLPELETINSFVYILPSVIEDHVVEVTENICRQMLSLVQALTHHSEPPRLYVVSVENTRASCLSKSSLWGFVQTLQMEHPELHCTHLQVDNLDNLVAELLSASPETQVKFTTGVRQVARLESFTEDLSRNPFQNSPIHLVTTQTGTLNGLQWKNTQVRQPQANEVTIRVQATGLNFKDVLIAMGQYPEAAPLGSECVGVVIEVGADVSDLQPGQLVMAIAYGSFSRFVNVHRNLVTPVPPNVTITEAATLPVVFSATYYGLFYLAKLQPGERLLLHGATGGIGQAAIQIAQQVGAEIFATASPDKWDALKALGVSHIMESRSLGFADEIMAETDGQGVDVVINALPGDFRIKSLEALGTQGRFIEMGKGDGLKPHQMTQLRPGIQHFNVDMSSLCAHQPEVVQSILLKIAQQINAGAWMPLPATEFSQNDVIQAFRMLQQSKHIGKIVVTQNADFQIPDHVSATSPEIALRSDSTYLITGGLGGLGLTTARWMVDHGAKHIALMSRREPSDAVRAEIKILENRGVTIDLLLADVADQAAVTKALNSLEQQQLVFPGGLRGIIHGAGVLEDSFIQQMDWSQFKKVLAPKLSGAWNLHTLTRNSDLDFFVLFSSAAALLGSPGQANHAAANAFLDGLARYRQQMGLPGLSINWGAWSSVGSALKYQQQGTLHKLTGVEVITPEQGLAKLEQIWSTSSAQVGVVPINWSVFLTQFLVNDLLFFQTVQAALPSSASSHQSHVPASQPFLEQLKATHAEQQRQLLDTYVCQQVCCTLGFRVEELDLNAGFFDLGMDSLTALELKNNLQSNLGLSLPSTLVFDYPTVATLLDYLATMLLKAEIKPASASAIHQGQGHIDTVEKSIETSSLPSGNTLAVLMDEKLADIEALLGEGDAS
ncbi:type I polyketide synthase [Acaryochloris sp. IP29b_bin.137]|uniref:type I polyketide synthase n=1 Tax=Acaryochloris sp. IP29b_bin.137 TaxID=2969217 RepID=UPI00261373A7|nr:type I polyketide synthase [Acaryochloris sp. IP29b_bin.137]